MKTAILLHNSGAGDEGHSADALLRVVRSEGYECTLISTKEKGWKLPEALSDFIIVAGGDGTVKKMAEKMLDLGEAAMRVPIALLPLGTANNIARSLGISGTPDEIAQTWRTANFQVFNTGVVTGFGKPLFFLESFGCGLFPRLMKDMTDLDDELSDEPERRMNEALKLLHRQTLEATANNCTLTLDGKDYSGKYLMIEVMNIRSVGPNLLLAPAANSGDGRFDVVLVPEDHRGMLAGYVNRKIAGEDEAFPGIIIPASEIAVRWEGTQLHTDDQRRESKHHPQLHVRVGEAALSFMIPSAVN